MSAPNPAPPPRSWLTPGKCFNFPGPWFPDPSDGHNSPVGPARGVVVTSERRLHVKSLAQFVARGNCSICVNHCCFHGNTGSQRRLSGGKSESELKGMCQKFEEEETKQSKTARSPFLGGRVGCPSRSTAALRGVDECL